MKTFHENHEIGLQPIVVKELKRLYHEEDKNLFTKNIAARIKKKLYRDLLLSKIKQK